MRRHRLLSTPALALLAWSLAMPPALAAEVGTPPDVAPPGPGPVPTRLVLDSELTLIAPARVVDGRRGRLVLRHLRSDGAPVAGRVTVERRRTVLDERGRWRLSGWEPFRSVRTDASGKAVITIKPRWNHRWRARSERIEVTAASTAVTTVVHATRTPVSRTRNVPPGNPVVLPTGAPKPTVSTVPQRRAVGAGANVRITAIPARIWREMNGVTWRPGCPVGRSGLRLVRANYWAFDGYRRRGELVVNAHAAEQFRGALRAMHRERVPVRSMIRPEEFGRSAVLGGADDMRSMAAGNTSVFNCRGVVGRPGVLSPHSDGRSFDLNPWENPYRSGWGIVPNTWWDSRAHADVAWRSHDHRVVRLLARHGFRWTYGLGDMHHFDAR